MATDSPKIPNYVPQVVYDQLMQFKAKRGLKSISMVVTAVLEEYFGLKKAPIGAATASRLETLEDRVASLTFTVAALSRAMLHLLLLPALSSIGLKYRDTTFDRD